MAPLPRFARIAHVPPAMTTIAEATITGTSQVLRLDEGGATASGPAIGDVRSPFVDIAWPGEGAIASSLGDVINDASSLRNPSRAALMSASLG